MQDEMRLSFLNENCAIKFRCAADLLKGQGHYKISNISSYC